MDSNSVDNSNSDVLCTTMIDELLNTLTTSSIDDAELLKLLSMSSFPSTTLPTVNQDELAVLDWYDMPELSEAEDEDDIKSTTSAACQNKRKYDDSTDIFADYDFVDASIIFPTHTEENKKIKFSQDSQESLLNRLNSELPGLDEDDERLALDLASN